MARFRGLEILPGRILTVVQNDGGSILVGAGGDTLEIDPETAAHVFVRTA